MATKVTRVPANPEDGLDGNPNEHSFVGGMVKSAFSSYSKTAIDLEKIVCGYDAQTVLANLAKTNTLARVTSYGSPFIPSAVIAQYKLTDYYLSSDGDVWQTIELPLDLSATELLIHGDDPGAEGEIEALFSARELDIYQFALDMMTCLEIYGCAYPFLAWDGAVPVHRSLFNPRYIAVGPMMDFGQRPLWLTGAHGFDDRLAFLPPAIRDALGPSVNSTPNGVYVELKPANCQQVRDWTLPYHPYPVAPLARAFRTMSTRQTLEEMIRSTIEGFKNQLWVFLLGDIEHPPTRRELNELRGQISGSRGDRTGFLVWGGNLRVEQHTPKPLDQVLGDNTWQALTRHIFRQRGISIRLIDGDIQQSLQEGPSPLDIRVLLQRLRYRRSRAERWLNTFVRDYAHRNGMQKPPLISFEPISLDIENKIKNQLMPLASAGYLSNETVLEQAHVSNYRTELARKKSGEGDEHLFAPKPTYAQATVNPNTPASTTSHGTPGRAGPGKAQDNRPRKDSAGQKVRPTARPQGQATKGSYHEEIDAAYRMMLEGGEPAEFGLALKEIGERYLDEAYAAGYDDNGGREAIAEARVQGLHAWHAGFVDRFVSQVEEALAADEEAKLTGWQDRRLALYAQGERLGYVYGMFQAKAEAGYTGWRRQVGADACADCQEDAKIVHHISEEFFEVHPCGNCGADFISFFRGERSAMPVVLPHPAGVIVSPRATKAEE